MSPDSIYIWKIAYSTYLPKVKKLWSVLSLAEQKLSSRFLLKKHQNRYVISRGILRYLLSRLLELPPEKIELSYTRYGKPILLNPLLEFNISHSRNQLVYAFSKVFPVGVDIEYISYQKPIGQLLKRYFSISEQRFFLSLNDIKKQKAFYRGWVQKEAITKALGYGLCMPLRDLEVQLYPLTTPVNYTSTQRSFLVYPVQVPKNFMSVLAVDTKEAPIRLNYQSYLPLMS